MVIEFPEAQLGECSLDRTGEWACAAIKQGPYHGLAAGHTNGYGWHITPFPRTVIHPQFHPLEPEWIEFAGDPAPRLHRVKRTGQHMECLHAHNNDEFIVHETFLGKTGHLVFVVWPHSLRKMDWTTREITTILDFGATETNAWHIAPNRAGTQILCDTNHPDRGIFLIDTATGAQKLVCLSESSNLGTQWAKSSYALTEDFTKARCDNLSWMETPTDTVYGPQWTHPHPAFSANERYVTFASDKTGHTQVYVAELE
jgi:oligogalacturonide lyase